MMASKSFASSLQKFHPDDVWNEDEDEGDFIPSLFGFCGDEVGIVAAIFSEVVSMVGGWKG